MNENHENMTDQTTAEQIGINPENESKQSKIKKLFAQFIKFGLVGVSNTLIGYGIYYIVIFINKDLYLIGNLLGFIVGTLNSFYWNSKYVFPKYGAAKGKILIKTFICYGITLLLSTGILYLLVDIWSISAFVAPIINLCVTVPLNFLLNKFWAYK